MNLQTSTPNPARANLVGVVGLRGGVRVEAGWIQQGGGKYQAMCAAMFGQQPAPTTVVDDMKERFG